MTAATVSRACILALTQYLRTDPVGVVLGAHASVTLVPLDAPVPALVLDAIWSLRARRVGWGGAMLRTVLHFADRHGVAVHADVLPLARQDGGDDGDAPAAVQALDRDRLGLDQLFAWYRRHGFEESGLDPDLYYEITRLPSAPPVPLPRALPTPHGAAPGRAATLPGGARSGAAAGAMHVLPAGTAI